MSFEDVLRAKVEARRRNGSPVEATARTMRDQAFDRHRAVYDAVAEMAGRLAQNSVFAAGFGSAPKVEFRNEVTGLGEASSVDVEGPVGQFSVMITGNEATPWRPAHTSLKLKIIPEFNLRHPLGCSYVYAEATPLRGTTADISGFIVAVEDLLAEFLADVLASPVSSKFLPGLPPEEMG